MRVLVYGAGAVGGYLGAKLSLGGHDVTLITRQFAAETINAGGLSLTEVDSRVVSRPKAMGSVAQAFSDDQDDYDLIIMSMKSYDLRSALDPLVAFCPEPPPIIAVQNGIDVEMPLIKQYGAERIIAGSLTTPIQKETLNSLVVARTDRGLGLSPTEPRQNIKQWVNLFNAAGVDTVKVSSYQSMRWSKALLNIVGNASSAILNRSPDIVYKSAAMFDLEVRMLRETLAVMDKLNLKVSNLPGSPARQLSVAVKRMPLVVLKPLMTGIVAKGRGGKMPSFHIDLASGKGQSEVMYHNGAIARAGKAAGVPTPVNQVLTDVLLRLTREEVDWHLYDGKPKALLMDVKRHASRKDGA